jgi:hypothetical protein
VAIVSRLVARLYEELGRLRDAQAEANRRWLDTVAELRQLRYELAIARQRLAELNRIASTKGQP